MKRIFLSVVLTVIAATSFAQFADKVELNVGFGVDYQTTKTQIESTGYSESSSTTQITGSIGANYFVTNNFQLGLRFDFMHQEEGNAFALELPLSFWVRISEPFYWTPSIIGGFFVLSYPNFDVNYSGVGFEVQPLTFAAKISDKFLAKISLFSFVKFSLECEDIIKLSQSAFSVGGPEVGISFLL